MTTETETTAPRPRKLHFNGYPDRHRYERTTPEEIEAQRQRLQASCDAAVAHGRMVKEMRRAKYGF